MGVVIGKKNASRRGLSLVELSVVILLIGMLMTMLFAVVMGVIDIISVVSPSIRTKSQAFLALNNVRSCLNQTYFNPNTPTLWFLADRKGEEGTRITLSCAHPGSEDLGRPSVREVSYYLKRTDSDADGTYTLYRREDELVDDEPGAGGFHYPLLHNVKKFDMRFTLDGKNWVKSWKSSDLRRIPRIIEIKMVVELEKGRGDKKEKKLFSLQTLSRPGLYIR